MKEQPSAVPFLPEIYGELVRRPKEAGVWESYSELLNKLPDDLSIKGNATADSLTAIPTVWARPLLFAEALFDERHPLHDEVENEWRGLLAIFCFADYYKYSLSAQRTALHGSTERFAKVLRALSPDNHWLDMHLIYLNDSLIGGTSPKSLFFTAAEYQVPAIDRAAGNQRVIPWVSEQTGRLIDAAGYFVGYNMGDELTILAGWLEHTIDELVKAKIPGDDKDESTKDNLLRLLQRWKDSFKTPGLVEQLTFTNPKVDAEPFKHVSQTVIDKGRLRSDFLLMSTKGSVQSPILIWDEAWKSYEGNVIYGALRLKDIPIPEGTRGETLLNGRINYPWIRPDLYFFTDKLLMLNLVKENILICSEQGYIPPLRKEILDYFNVEDLKDSIEWDVSEEYVTVTLSLPLKTGEGQRSSIRSARISRAYGKLDIQSFVGRTVIEPFLNVWPDFEVLGADGLENQWQHYYCICEKKTSPLSVRPFNEQSLPEIRNKSLLWRLNGYPEALECFWDNDPAGLLLLKPARKIEGSYKTWTVGVDFGTSNTSIFYRESEEESPMPLPINNHWIQITQAQLDELKYYLFTQFLPLTSQSGEIEGIFPSLFLLFKQREVAPEPFIDGIILFDEPTKWPDLISDSNVQQNLKWTDDRNKRRLISAFLKQILLMIGAEAKKNQVSALKLRWSYPSAFSKKMVNEFQAAWEQLKEKASSEIGLDITIESYETESVAVCKYMMEEQQATVAASSRAQVIVDIGGGTSDIAVWLGGDLKAQTSLLLAGNIISEYAEKSPDFRDAIAEIVNIPDLARLMKDRNLSSAVLNIVLKRNETRIIHDIVTAALDSKPAFVRARTIILFTFSAVLYYVGLILKHLNSTNPIDAADIYLSGNGAKLLTWVSSDSGRTDALKAILRKAASTVSLNEVTLKFTNAHKQEVARGLLFTNYLPDAESRIVQIVGETGYKLMPEAQDLSAEFDLHGQSEVIERTRLQVPADFPELRKFVEAFDEQARELGLQEVSALLNQSAIKARIETTIAKWSLGKKTDVALIQPFFVEEVRFVLSQLIDQSVT